MAITSPAYTVLNLNTLTADITPASGVDGVLFSKLAGDVTVNVDLTRASVPGSITVTGTEAAGIYALSWEVQ